MNDEVKKMNLYKDYVTNFCTKFDEGYDEIAFGKLDFLFIFKRSTTEGMLDAVGNTSPEDTIKLLEEALKIQKEEFKALN